MNLPQAVIDALAKLDWYADSDKSEAQFKIVDEANEKICSWHSMLGRVHEARELLRSFLKSQPVQPSRAGPGIINGLMEAVKADFARVTIDGVTWVREQPSREGEVEPVAWRCKLKNDSRAWILRAEKPSPAHTDEWVFEPLYATLAGALTTAWVDISCAPKDGTEILYVTSLEEIGHCRWTVSGDPDLLDGWFDQARAEEDIAPVGWLPALPRFNQYTALAAAPPLQSEPDTGGGVG